MVAECMQTVVWHFVYEIESLGLQVEDAPEQKNVGSYEANADKD